MTSHNAMRRPAAARGDRVRVLCDGGAGALRVAHEIASCALHGQSRATPTETEFPAALALPAVTLKKSLSMTIRRRAARIVDGRSGHRDLQESR